MTVQEVERELRRMLEDSQRRMDAISPDVPPEHRAGRIRDVFALFRDDLRDLLWRMGP